MLTLTLTLATLGLLCLLIGAAQQARHTIPAPASGWRDGDVFSRPGSRGSTVDQVQTYNFTACELFLLAEEARVQGCDLTYIRDLMDLGYRCRIGERISHEQEHQRRQRRHVQVRVRVVA